MISFAASVDSLALLWEPLWIEVWAELVSAPVLLWGLLLCSYAQILAITQRK